MAGGCVVMVSSTRGLIGGVNTGPYSCAAAAQIALMQGYAREWPGVRFNVMCPGLTDTRMAAQVRATGGAKPDAIAQPPRAVAQVIVDLLEGDANGKVVRGVDGEAQEECRIDRDDALGRVGILGGVPPVGAFGKFLDAEAVVGGMEVDRHVRPA